MIDLFVLITNFSDLINGTGIINYSLQPYTDIIGYFVYQLIFCGVIGYVYMKQQSVIAASVVTLILFAAFDIVVLGGTGSAETEAFTTLMHVLVSIAVGVLFLMIFIRSRGR